MQRQPRPRPIPVEFISHRECASPVLTAFSFGMQRQEGAQAGARSADTPAGTELQNEQGSAGVEGENVAAAAGGKVGALV